MQGGKFTRLEGGPCHESYRQSKDTRTWSVAYPGLGRLLLWKMTFFFLCRKEKELNRFCKSAANVPEGGSVAPQKETGFVLVAWFSEYASIIQIRRNLEIEFFRRDKSTYGNVESMKSPKWQNIFSLSSTPYRNIRVKTTKLILVLENTDTKNSINV